MKTRNIFIDTQAFMKQGFKFENNILSRIKELGSQSLIKIYISEVVKQEVSSKIIEKLSKAKKAKDDLIKELSILESDIPKSIKEMLNNYESIEINDIAKKRWDQYIEDSKITILDPNTICNQELLSLYFSGEFPFSEGKKKDEFPDAISLLSLKVWAKNNKKIVYIISDDNDLKGFCLDSEYFISIRHLSEFLDLYNRAEERLTNIVHGYIDKEIKWITDNIENSFKDCSFTYENNWDSNVNSITIKDTEIDEIDIIKVEDSRAIITLRAEISYTANITGPDYDNSVWDSEDKEYIFIEHFNVDFDFYDVYIVSMEVFFDEKQNELTEIGEVIFDDSNEIKLYYDDGYPYR